MFNPSEPKLKMKAEGISTPTPTPVVKTGSFLDAMKAPGFGVDKPDGPLNNTNTPSFRPTQEFNNPNAGFQFPVRTLPPPSSSSAGFNFGSPFSAPSSTGQNTGNTLFQFGSQQPTSAPVDSSVFTPNLVPNLSFGSSAPPGSAPVLFSAGSAPPQSGDMGRRPTKRAVRRLR